MIKRCLMAVVIAAFAAGSAFAAHPLITDDTGTQGKGKFQLEMNGEFAHEADNGLKADTAEVAATLSYGASDTVDIILGVPFQWLRLTENGNTARESGPSDVSIEVKWRFIEQEKFSLALKPGVFLPIGDDEKSLGSGKVNFSMSLISTADFSPLSIHVNLGYLRNENDNDERKNLWHASVGAEYAAAEKVTIVGNAGIEQNADRNVNTHPAFILGGMIYSISEQVDAGIGIKAGLTAPETDYAILAGIAWSF